MSTATVPTEQKIAFGGVTGGVTPVLRVNNVIASTTNGRAREMQVEDLDGNILRIGSEPSKNEPIGDWLDMHGVRWRKLPNGGHQRTDPS
jgi:hypothetical protein